MFTLKKVLVICSALAAIAATPDGFCAYNFVEGYNVLDTNNAPGIGTNYAATSGAERDIGVDTARGIIYMARGTLTGAAGPDGRPNGVIGIAAIVVTNGARAGSNFRDTGLINAPASGLGFCQSLAFDPVGDKLWVFGSPIGANPNVWFANGGTLGGAPDGDNPGAPNSALVKAFQVDTNLLDPGVYVNPQVSTNGALQRGGQPRGFAVRTVGTNTTVYLGMGNHVEAWSNDQPLTGTNSVWRRVWATLRPPAGNLTSTRVTTAFSGVNGVAVDDDGNCYFSVQTTGGRIWCVRPAAVQAATDPMSLDFNDVPFGGTSTQDVVSLIYSASPDATLVTPPQAITFARFDAQKTLFVSFLPGVAQRGVTRLDIDNNLSFTNGGAYIAARAVDGFGSGQPAGGQDTILPSMRLKQAAAGQPQGASNGLLYHDVDSITNPTYIYLEGFVIDTNKSQTIPTAAVMKVRIGVDTNPPSILAQPQAQTLFEGGTISLTVGAAGFKPLSFRWQSNLVDIPNATNATYSLVPASTNNSGSYRVIVTNSLGSITSAVAQVTVQSLLRSAALTPLWSVPAGSRYYLTANDTQRGLAYNPNTGDLLVTSRSPTNSIQVLSSADGTGLFQLRIDPGVVSGGTAGFAINMIGASDDGTIYVCNLAQNAELFRIYRWSSEDTDTTPTIAFSGTASSLGAARFGDTFDVRGSANQIQILAGSRNSNVVAIFTTIDNGVSFAATSIVVPGVTNGAFGLGVSFDGPDTFWGKGDSNTGLRKVQFDLGAGIGTVLQTYGSSNYPPGATIIGVEHDLNVLAAISIENPDNLRLYDISDLATGPRLVDQELFPTDNENLNGTGAIDFGEGKVFALDSNNGIMALTLGAIPPPGPGRINITRTGGSVTLTWSGAYTLQAANVVTGPYDDVIGAISGYSELTSTAQQRFFRLRN